LGRCDWRDLGSQPHRAAERVRADTFATVAQDAPSPMLRMGPLPRVAWEDPPPRVPSTARQTGRAAGGKQSGFSSHWHFTTQRAGPNRGKSRGCAACPLLWIAGSFVRLCHQWQGRPATPPARTFRDSFEPVTPPRSGPSGIGYGGCAIQQRESETTMPTPGPRTRPPRRRRWNPSPQEASPTCGQDRPTIRALDPPPFMGEGDHAKHGGGGS